MDIKELTENQFVDIFATGADANQGIKAGFGMNEEATETDLFPPKLETTVTKTAEELKAEADAKVLEDAAKAAEGDGENKETDILGTTKQPGRRPKYDFTDTSGYFEDRFKSGKFVAINEEDAEGNVKPFIPKTPEEFDEVIDLQVNYQLDKKKKDLDSSWYQSKSPAWQAVAKYAEMTDDPTEILPFIQGIKTIDSVSAVDESTEAGAEIIIRARLEQRGESKDIIDEQIEALRSTDRLISTASKYKPMILQQEKQQLAQMVNQKRAQDAEYKQLVEGIKTNAIKAIEAPIYGNQKLKQDEKHAIYELIAEPSEDTKGYLIYTAIDNLFEKGDFETLKKIALLVSKEKSFLQYISASAKQEAAEGLQKKLRIAGDGRNSAGTGTDGEDDETKPSVRRNQYNPTAKFGR